jgi:hypothetical protein
VNRISREPRKSAFAQNNDAAFLAQFEKSFAQGGAVSAKDDGANARSNQLLTDQYRHGKPGLEAVDFDVAGSF